jgi:putative tryptophan/tyrosine transport system substrate-binding protein
LLLLGGALTASRALRAQQKAIPVIGYLRIFSPPPGVGDPGPILQGLGETGFVEGQNMMSEYRFAEFHYDRLPALAADLVNRNPDVPPAARRIRSEPRPL